jgi:hypothetical protein
MIEVFKTDVKKVSQAKMIVALLIEHFPCSKINFDLKDCDKVLRVEGEHVVVDKIIMLITEKGFECAVLDDVVPSAV